MTFIGCVDVVSGSCIGGWAADQDDLAREISVDIAVNSAVVATVCCSEFREDLPGAGIGDGWKAFHYDPGTHLRPGRNLIEVRYAASDQLVHQGRGYWVLPREAPSAAESALVAALESYHQFQPDGHICWIGEGGGEFECTLYGAQVPFRRYSVLDGPPHATLPVLAEKADVVICPQGDHMAAGWLQHLLGSEMNCGGLLAVGFREIPQPAKTGGIAGVKFESIAFGDAALFAFAEARPASPMLAHIHVPKCAGTSLRVLLERHFAARHLSLYVDDTYFVYSQEDLRNYLLRNPDTAGFSSHHIRTFPRWLAGRKMLYVTFLRDPVEQFVSYMTHIKKYYSIITSPTLREAVPPDARQVPFRDFARWLLTHDQDIPFRENHNVNFFARHSHPEAADRLAAAQAALAEFFFVGITERMEESMAKLRARAEQAGLDFPPGPMLLENISHDYRDDLSWIHPDDEVGALLLRSVELDRQLYQWAADRLSGM